MLGRTLFSRIEERKVRSFSKDTSQKTFSEVEQCSPLGSVLLASESTESGE